MSQEMPNLSGGFAYSPKRPLILEVPNPSSLAFSPNSQLLAIGSGDSTIRLWNPAAGHPPLILSGHRGGVCDVAFSPNGQMLASGSADNTIKLWKPATGDCLRTLSAHTNSVHSLAFSPNSQMLASGSWDGTIRLWNPATGDCLRTLSDDMPHIFEVAFSPDGLLLAGAGSDSPWASAPIPSPIRLWNLATGEPPSMLSGHRSAVCDVAFSPNGLLASAGADGTTILWT